MNGYIDIPIFQHSMQLHRIIGGQIPHFGSLSRRRSKHHGERPDASAPKLSVRIELMFRAVYAWLTPCQNSASLPLVRAPLTPCASASTAPARTCDRCTRCSVCRPRYAPILELLYVNDGLDIDGGAL